MNMQEPNDRVEKTHNMTNRNYARNSYCPR